MYECFPLLYEAGGSAHHKVDSYLPHHLSLQNPTTLLWIELVCATSHSVGKSSLDLSKRPKAGPDLTRSAWKHLYTLT